MSMFGSIMHKIFHHDAAAATPDVEKAGDTLSVKPDGDLAAAAAGAMPAGGGAGPVAVDVGAVLTGMASAKGGGGNYQSSIVDLLKLLDMDSSLAARKDLANELNIHVGADGSAEENIALHRAVMQKLAENGGKVPDSLRG